MVILKPSLDLKMVLIISYNSRAMFLQECSKILQDSSWQGSLSPYELLEEWKQFVDECRSGYEMDIYEYDNDLSVRDAIEKIISEKRLKPYQEYQEFKNLVLSIDKAFQELLSVSLERGDRSDWWGKGVLKKAGEEYVNDIKDRYQFEVEVI